MSTSNFCPDLLKSQALHEIVNLKQVRVCDGLLVAVPRLDFCNSDSLGGRSLISRCGGPWNYSQLVWQFVHKPKLGDLTAFRPLFCVFQMHDISTELLLCSHIALQECFWLNEGFTKFGEARIMANMNGSEPCLHPASFRRISFAFHEFSMEMPIFTWKLGRCQGLWEAPSAEWLPSTGPRCGALWSWARVYQTVCLDGEMDGNGWFAHHVLLVCFLSMFW